MRTTMIHSQTHALRFARLRTSQRRNLFFGRCDSWYEDQTRQTRRRSPSRPQIQNPRSKCTRGVIKLLVPIRISYQLGSRPPNSRPPNSRPPHSRPPNLRQATSRQILALALTNGLVRDDDWVLLVSRRPHDIVLQRNRYEREQPYTHTPININKITLT